MAQTPATYAGTTSVNHASAPLTVSIAITQSGVGAVPVAVTQGIIGLDFGVAGGSCLTTINFTAGQSCTVSVIFQPKSPGLRNGAVVLQTIDGTVLGTTLLAGVGQGALAVLEPGQIDTVAGNAAWTFKVDGVLATLAPIFLPTAVVADAAGNIFLSDSANNRVRRVDVVTGFISTVAGNGTPGFLGDGGLATNASINTPAGLAIDGAGNLFFVDSNNDAIRRVDAHTHIITTVAGTGGTAGYTGDGGLATAATLNVPNGIAFDVAGNLYIADTSNNAIRKIDASTGYISTIAGTGATGYNGDSILATTATLNSPWDVTVGVDGSIYVADLSNNRIRKIDKSGMITTVAGTGATGYGGDTGLATGAVLNAPTAVVLDPAGNLYIADSTNNRVRKVNVSDGTISTLTGTGSESFAGDAGPANNANVNGPYGLYFDNVTGNLFIADFFHNRIRRISATTIALSYATIRVSKVSPPQTQGLENDGNADLTSLTPVLVNAALDPGTTTCDASPLASDGFCKLGVEFAPTVVGTLVLGTVTLNSSATNSPNIVNLSGEVLTVEPTTVTLTSSANPSLQNAAVKFTATVHSADTSRGGPVTFYDGTNAICTAIALDAAGTASCTTSTLVLGSHNITANYGGDPNNEAAVSSPLIQIVQQPTTLLLVATPTSAVVATPVVLTVTASAATGVPTGLITFYDGTISIGTANLVAGVATFSTSNLSPTANPHDIIAKYVGDTNDAAGSSNDVIVNISEGTTVTTIATTNPNVNYGTAVTFTANVTSTDGPVPTGTVQFMEGNTLVGTGTLTGAGIAKLTISSLAPGNHNIIAAYQGDASDSAANSAPLLETVQKISTTMVLTSGAGSAIAGTPILLTAKVAIVAGATADGAMTGLVTFSNGATVLGTAPVNAAGIATLSVNTLPVGDQSITALYAGDSNYIPSNSSPLPELISVASMSLTLAGPSSVDVATPAVFTVLLTTSGPAPSGVLTLLDGSTTAAVQVTAGPGTYTFTTSSLSLGSHTLTASFGGDTNYATTVSNKLSVTVKQASSSTALQSNLNPQIVGQNVVLTATVTSDSPNPGGTVTFNDGPTSLGSKPVGPLGTATLTTSTLLFGAHNLTATYSGDTNHITSISPPLNQKIVEPATIALTTSVTPATASAAVIFTARLTGTASMIPTGIVTFLDGSTVIGTGTIDLTGTASFSTNALLVGSHPITASYAGDQNFSTATSTPLIETIQDASTQITISTTANPAIYGTPLGITVSVATNGPIATGSVTFTDSGTPIGTVLLTGSGSATLTLSTLGPGSHTIIATYGGDGATSPSISTPFIITVQQLTSTLLASNINPALTLSPILLTATVTNSGVGIATGNVTFTDGSTLLGTSSLDPTGHATFTVPSLSAGNHTIVATYAGDGSNFSSVSAGLPQGVQLRPTATALTAVASNPANPQQVTLISVVRWTGPATPTGTITFTSGSTVVGSGAVDASGVATMTVFVPSGSESIVASYSGDSAYAPSASLVTSITGSPATQFTLQIDPPTMTVQTKQHGVVNITITSITGFTDNMQFGCLGLPFAATCTFSSTQMVLPANGKQSLQLTIDTGDPLGAGATASNTRTSGSNVLLCFLPGSLLVGFLLFRRKRSLPMLGIIVLVLGMGAMLSATGCAGLQINGTPAGTYTFKVAATGTQTGASSSQTMTLTVTQ
jgi:sugar lactone lactonase YvrE